jgi:hypothetical protein
MEKEITMLLKNNKGGINPVLKILTDYPRDDLAHDEVHQSLVTACVRHGLAPANIDVGSIPGLDTVTAGFKTAQLALNSQLGYGHVFHANCAPRRNIASVKSAGEKIVLGITKSGVTMLIVNSGYALAPFRDSMEAGDVAFFRTSVRDAGSQFRSRDYFPEAMVELAAHLVLQADKVGAAEIRRCLKAGAYSKILKGLPWLGAPVKPDAAPKLPAGTVMYIDNFGNVKLNIRHADLLKNFRAGDVLAVKIGNTVRDAIIGGVGFSQAEGMLALTSGSSGWDVGGKKTHFTEIMLRGGSAAALFGDFSPGDKVTMLRENNLQRVNALLHAAGGRAAERLSLNNISDAKIIAMLARSRLIRNGYDTRELRKTLKSGDLLKKLVT